jgi:hypothetical protein
MGGEGARGDERGTKRIAWRMPVVVLYEREGKPHSTDAWTTNVSMEGARLECKRRFEVSEEVLIQAPSTGLSEKATIVWRRDEPDEHGSYETEVQLGRAANLWGASFAQFAPEAMPSAAPGDEGASESSASESSGLPRASTEQLARMVREIVERTLERRLDAIASQLGGRMESRVRELVQSGSAQIERETSELITGARELLRHTVQGELPVLEKEVLERCRVQSERLLAMQVEQWSLLLSDRLRDAERKMAQQTAAVEKEAAERQWAAVEERTEQQLASANTKLEQQMTRVGTQVRQSFLRHVAAELNRNQQAWMEKAKEQMDEQAARNLQRTRGQFFELLKQLGETLIRQAYAESGTPLPLAPAGETGTETRGAGERSEAATARERESEPPKR